MRGWVGGKRRGGGAQDISTLYTVLIGVRKLDTIREQYGIAIIRGPIIADYARL